jgi:hypothetical protein
MLHTVAEAVFISFFMGAIVGGAIVAHFQLKSVEQNEDQLQPVKVKISDHDQ